MLIEILEHTHILNNKINIKIDLRKYTKDELISNDRSTYKMNRTEDKSLLT